MILSHHILEVRSPEVGSTTANRRVRFRMSFEYSGLRNIWRVKRRGVVIRWKRNGAVTGMCFEYTALRIWRGG